jgi:hypothetical protein
MFGSPTIAQLENPSYKPGIIGMKKVDGPPEQARAPDGDAATHYSEDRSGSPPTST